jgi:death-on-curing protein
MDPIFLILAEVLEIHQDQIERYGGTVGIRDLELLKSALGLPAATFDGDFLHADIYEMAAAYLFHMVRNHPFIDGNKRTATVAALVFLLFNGFDLNAPEKELVKAVLAVASGKMAKAELAMFFRKWVRKAAGKRM